MNSVVKELIEFEIVHDVFWSFCQLQDDLSSRLFDSMHHFSVSLPFHLETVHTYDPITDLEKKKEKLTNYLTIFSRPFARNIVQIREEFYNFT